MDAISLHHAIFTNERDSDLPLRSAASFLRSAPEREANPTSQLHSSEAYQDLVQRQPTHPDGPTSGWDLGLNLLGDPITAAEHKSSEDHQTKTKLRRLYAINFTFELLFGVWAMYATVRYLVAVADSSSNTEHVYALVLGITSAIAVAFVIISIFMPLFPKRGHLLAWWYARSLLRAGYLLLLSAGAILNTALVLLWHPNQLCDWDIDISWYTSAANATSPCDIASFSMWLVAAILRLVVTLTVALSFIYTLRSYYGTRYPASGVNSPKYSPYFPSDPEDISPVLTSSPHHFAKSTKFMQSGDSNHTLNRSNTTLPKYNSISTLAPSTSCTGHSRSHSDPLARDVPIPRISPPTSRRTSSHATSYGSSQTQVGFDVPSQAHSVSVVTALSWVAPMLRRTSRSSIVQAMPDTMLSDMHSQSDRLSSPTTHDSPEIRSWKPGHRGSGVNPDAGKASLAWENTHARRASQVSVGPESSSTSEDGESIEEKDKQAGTLVYSYSYGYGASDSTYPYLDMYNPQSPNGYGEPPLPSEDADEHGRLQGHRRSIPSGPALHDVSSEPRSSPSREEEESSGEEEEYVAMMGGFVRRMATIESLGSREAAGTLSTTTGSVALHSMRSGAPASRFSSVRFADISSAASSSMGVSSLSGKEGSPSTAYLSFSSGGTGMQVNERGELFPGSNASVGSAGSPLYHTASSGGFLRVDGEDR